jgi:thermitase
MPPTDEPPLGEHPNNQKHTDNNKRIKLKFFKEVSFSLKQLAIFILVFGALGGWIIWKSFAATPSLPAQTAAASEAVPDQLLVRFKANATKAQRDNVLKQNNLNIVKEIPQIGVKVIKTPPNAADAVKNALSHNPAIDFVEQDRVLKPQEQLPDDPYFPDGANAAIEGANWPAHQISAPQAWDITEGTSSTVIAILDTGIKTAGLADYDGQISSTWNVINNSTDATTSAGNHGTYVAGAAAAAINNGVGNNGICPKCKMMIVQVGTDSGANLSDLASGMTYAADHGAKVINLSWGGPNTSSALSSAASYAHSKGLVLFAAAGNSNCDCVFYPAATNYVLGVAGTSNASGGTTKAGDSNYGNWVAIAAPEGYITGSPTINGKPGYAPVGGTSLASPVAAGVAGLLFSQNPSLTNTQVEQAMESTSVHTSFTIKYGRVDVLAALQSLGANDPQPSSVPIQVAPPRVYYITSGATDLSHIAPLSAAPQVGQALVRGVGGWTGSTPLSIDSLAWYKCDTAGNNCSKLPNDDIYTGPYRHTVQSSEAGSTIKMVVSVKNSLGTITQSALTGVVGGSSTPPPTVSLSASPAAITAGQSSTLTWSSTNATACTAAGAWGGTQPTSGTAVVSPTANATYTLTCTGASGSASASASIVVSPATAPPATPTGLAPTPLDSSVTLTWNANTESDLAGYDLQYKTTSGSTWTQVSGLTSITYSVSGLTNGTSYDFQVRARNTAGQTSAWTATVSATPQGSQPADTTAPTVTINSPVNGASITSAKKVNISASATDDNVVIKLELYIDGQLKTTVTTPTLSYNWNINRNVASGNHTITVKAYDQAGNIGSNTVTVTK